MAILNEDLLNDTAPSSILKLQAKIAKLERTIESFKEYDKQRTEYYKDAIIRLGQLEAFVEEISTEDKKVKKLIAYKEQLKLLNKKCFLDNISRLSDIEIISTYDSIASKQEAEKLRATIKSLRASYKTLLDKYMALINKTSSAQTEELPNNPE